MDNTCEFVEIIKKGLIGGNFKRFYVEDDIYFRIFDYDVRYFKEVKDETGKKRSKMLLSINTYPNKPELYGRLLFNMLFCDI